MCAAHESRRSDANCYLCRAVAAELAATTEADAEYLFAEPHPQYVPQSFFDELAKVRVIESHPGWSIYGDDE